MGKQHQGMDRMEFGDPSGQQKTGKGGNVLLQRHMWWPDDLG